MLLPPSHDGRSLLPQIPPLILAMCRLVCHAGHQAYFVGGCVRDFLLGKRPDDFDLTADADPSQLLALFLENGYSAYRKGGRLGTIEIEKDGFRAEITPFRQEEGTDDFRHPHTVHFVHHLEQDLARRDFTINAIALSCDGEIVDPFHGRNDLAQRLVRCVGQPNKRFAEDVLRIYRAIRFAARYRFEIEGQTKRAMADCQQLLLHLKGERIREEWEKIFCIPCVCAYLTEFSGIMAVLAQGFCPVAHFDTLPFHFPIRLYACVRHYDENALTALCIRLRLSKAECRFLLSLRTLDHSDIEQRDYENNTLPVKRAIVRFGPEIVMAGCAMKQADSNAIHAYLKNGVYTKAKLALKGDCLAALGVQPAKRGKVLDILLDEVMAGKLANTRQALIQRALEL